MHTCSNGHFYFFEPSYILTTERAYVENMSAMIDIFLRGVKTIPESISYEIVREGALNSST
jgi:hypothetical protein